MASTMRPRRGTRKSLRDFTAREVLFLKACNDAECEILDECREALWNDPETRGLLLSGAAPVQPVFERERALSSLRNLAHAPSIRRAMAGHELLHSALHSASSPGEMEGLRQEVGLVGGACWSVVGREGCLHHVGVAPVRAARLCQ